LLDQQLVQISVIAEATNIPAGIEVSVEGMEIGDAVHARDLTLPTDVTLEDEPELLVLHVIAAPTAAEIEADLGEAAPEAEEEAEAAEGAEAPAPEAGGGGEEPAAG
ncbi:MAG: 50S ribosomal protein L25, partial [Actinobacteria bacterium]|nr:50S ribosomal protein L25 [Actinomycetota bacterium]